MKAELTANKLFPRTDPEKYEITENTKETHPKWRVTHYAAKFRCYHKRNAAQTYFHGC